MKPSDRVLNVWASAQWHGGIVKFDECFEDLPPPEPIGKNTRQCDSSDELYESTPGKYKAVQPSHEDPRVLSALEQVEHALSVCAPPEWFRAYLLFCWPVTGRYQPPRSSDGYDLPREFVRSGGMREASGESPNRKLVAELARIVRRNYGDFVYTLCRTMGLPEEEKEA